MPGTTAARGLIAVLLGLLAGGSALASAPVLAPGRVLRPAAGERLTPPDAQRPAEEIAREFLVRELAPAGELVRVAELEAGGGIRVVRFEQRFDGRPVHLARAGVAVGADGSVLAARFGAFAPTGPQPPGSAEKLPTAASARDHALARRAWSTDELAPALRDAQPATAVLVPTLAGAEPAWRVCLAPPGDPTAAEAVIFARADGRELDRYPLHWDGIDSARVWPLDPMRPSEIVAFPDPVTNPSPQSPLGWASDEETSGNNVVAFLDRDGSLDPALGVLTAASGAPPVLDFPYTGDPAVDTDAAVTNVFWAVNFAHDRFRRIGFDEPAGAMQDDGWGRGGIGGDRVIASVQHDGVDGTVATNQVRFSRSADGARTTLEVGLFTDRDSGVTRDAAFETDLLLHEYAHGVTARMILGDPACLTGQQPSALAEGWSDFFAASFSGDPVVGAWLGDDAVKGLRNFALDANPLSYLNLCGGAGGCNAIADGGIWAGALWDIRELFVSERGAEGVEDAERLVLEGLRYTACRPSFVDARDGILLADEALFGGEHWCALWQLFAARGLGVDASSLGPNDELPEPGFQAASACFGTPTIALDRPVYGVESRAVVEVGDAAAPPGATVRVEASSGDVETLTLELLPGGPRLRAVLDLEPAAPSPGDGVLQVADGDRLTATYDAAGLSAEASVTSQWPIDYLIHLVLASNCQAEPDDDHADAPGYFIPGFLDAGESADVIFAFGSGSATPLPNASVTVESLNPKVSILPTGPVPLGTVPLAASGTEQNVIFTVHGVAADDVVAGEIANLRFRFESEGRVALRDLPIKLNMDYEVTSGASPFSRGVETFDAGSPTRDLWTHSAELPGADQWLLADCAGAGGTPGYGNTDLACAGYSDGQAAALLLSPPLLADMPADAVAWRYEGLSWENSVDLFVDERRLDLSCDLDLVVAFLTDDPDALPYDDPVLAAFGVVGDPIGAWSYQQNTAGFAPTSIDLPRGGQAATPEIRGGRRLAFVFWGDVIDSDDEPRCVGAANEGHFLLDNLAFTYEYVREIPEATPCSGACAVDLDVVALVDGPPCAGAPFTLDASGTEIAGCAGTLVFSFTGPGIPPEYALTTETVAPAVAEDDGRWTVTAACDLQPDCADSVTFQNGAPWRPAAGGPFDGTLRARRDGGDVVLSWIGAAGPPAYGAWKAAGRAELAAGVETWPLVGTTDEESLAGEAEIVLAGAADEPGLAHYQVLARHLCTDEPVLP